MKIAAIIAIVLAGLGMALGLVNYMLFLLEIHSPMITAIIWPIQTLLIGLPVMILGVAILVSPQNSKNSV